MMESFHSQRSNIPPSQVIIGETNDVNRNAAKTQSETSSCIQQVALYMTTRPLDVDVLIGRGRKNQMHPGNISFLQKINECLDLYLTRERGEKHLVVALILEWLVNRRGHFVKLSSEGCWVEVTEQVAKEKIALAFRHRKIRAKSESISAQLQSVGSVMGSFGDPGEVGTEESFDQLFDAAGTAAAAAYSPHPEAPATAEPTGLLASTAAPQRHPRRTPFYRSPQRPRVTDGHIGFQGLHGKVKAGPLAEISPGLDTNTSKLALVQVHSTSTANSSPLLSDEEILRAINEWENSTAGRGNLEARELNDKS